MRQDYYSHSLRRIYLLTLGFGAIGFVFSFWWKGPSAAYGFALGSLGSFGNLYLWDWLSRSVSGVPSGSGSRWRAILLASRYLLLIAGGYAIVKYLQVNVLAAILGLFCSTAATLTEGIYLVIAGWRSTGEKKPII